MYLTIVKSQSNLEETGYDSFLKSEISEFVGPMYEFSYSCSYTSRQSCTNEYVKFIHIQTLYVGS